LSVAARNVTIFLMRGTETVLPATN